MDNFETAYQSVIYKTRYSRWLDDEQRRETWGETVGRYVDYMFDHVNNKHGFEDENLKQEIFDAIYNLEVMPSMRAIRTAGPALARSNIAAYNCAALAVDRPEAFDEALYILMNGTGVGFSVEQQYVEQLPAVPSEFQTSLVPFMVPDSKEGWAEALNYVVTSLYNGIVPDWDLSNVRPKGARLKTFGGRASGPEPLDDLLNFVVQLFIEAAGRKLTSLECHEVMCKVGEIVVVGGVRRAALISLSDLNDDEMRDAKSGEWWQDKPHLRLANNSAVYETKPDRATFDREWQALRESGSGERGVFNRNGIRKKLDEINRSHEAALTNPCGEILLRNGQFCNLTSVVIRPDDTWEDIRRKTRVATVLGTFQSTLLDFPYLSDRWAANGEDEHLLGVSLNGIFNNPRTYERGKEAEDRLANLRDYTKAVNRQYAHKLGVKPSAAITTVKPEGNSSQLNNVSSGIHPWHSPYYVRNIRGNKSDPVSEFLKFYGVHTEDDVMDPDGTYVFSFPIEAPADAKFREELTAIEHLEVWKQYSVHWTDHNPSVTINVKDDEWAKVGDWVYDNFEHVVGVSFLPYSDHTYEQAPYEEIDMRVPDDARRFKELQANNPDDLPWELLSMFESEDTSKAAQAMSCMAGGCTIESI